MIYSNATLPRIKGNRKPCDDTEKVALFPRRNRRAQALSVIRPESGTKKKKNKKSSLPSCYCLTQVGSRRPTSPLDHKDHHSTAHRSLSKSLTYSLWFRTPPCPRARCKTLGKRTPYSCFISVQTCLHFSAPWGKSLLSSEAAFQNFSMNSSKVQ